MQHITHRLVVKPRLDKHLVLIIIIIARREFDTIVRFGLHIERYDVGQAVVVHVGGIGSH